MMRIGLTGYSANESSGPARPCPAASKPAAHSAQDNNRQIVGVNMLWVQQMKSGEGLKRQTLSTNCAATATNTPDVEAEFLLHAYFIQ